MDRSRHRRRRTVVLAAASAMVALAALISTATANKPHFATTISAKEHFDSGTFELVFSGRVRSSKGGCKRHRGVGLRVIHRGGGQPPVALGRDATDASGNWEIRMLSDGIAGDYVANAARVAKPNFVCRSAQSDPIDFGP